MSSGHVAFVRGGRAICIEQGEPLSHASAMSVKARTLPPRPLARHLSERQETERLETWNLSAIDPSNEITGTTPSPRDASWSLESLLNDGIQRWHPGPFCPFLQLNMSKSVRQQSAAIGSCI